MARSSLKDIYRRLFRRYGPQHWWPARTRFEMIVGAILTQNTAWSNVEKSIRALKRKRLLSVGTLAQTPPRTLARTVRSSGYFNMKARRIRSFLRHLKVRHASRLDIFLSQGAQTLRGELLSIDGIGPETADSIVLYAAEKPVFVVDAYTRRIFKRLGLLKGNEDYEVIRRFFETRLPRKSALFNEYHALIVRHAKEHCRTKPVCVSCPLDALCPKLIETHA